MPEQKNTIRLEQLLKPNFRFRELGTLVVFMLAVGLVLISRASAQVDSTSKDQTKTPAAAQADQTQLWFL